MHLAQLFSIFVFGFYQIIPVVTPPSGFVGQSSVTSQVEMVPGNEFYGFEEDGDLHSINGSETFQRPTEKFAEKNDGVNESGKYGGVVNFPLMSPDALPVKEALSSPYVYAKVWENAPKVPVLTYHQFAPDHAKNSTATKIRLSDFRNDLHRLYNAGYTLVSLADWLKGNIRTPAGRRPLILTIDDLFYNNQIALTPSGNPSSETGLGALWEFSRQHPDFGFEVALFASLGDKLYGNPDNPHWEKDLARVLVWCIEHHAMPYNHFYSHPRLDKTEAAPVMSEARYNDLYLRKLLQKVNRQDLVERIDNILALPYGYWPSDANARKLLKTYKDPEGHPLLAIMEINVLSQTTALAPVFFEGFNPLHTPRIVANKISIDSLVNQRADYPAASECRIALDNPGRVDDVEYIQQQIEKTSAQNLCSGSMYEIGERLFEMKAGKATLLVVYPVKGYNLAASKLTAYGLSTFKQSSLQPYLKVDDSHGL